MDAILLHLLRYLYALTSIYQHIPRFVGPAVMHIHSHGIFQCSNHISLNNRNNFRSSNVQVFASTASSILFSTSGQDSRVRVHFDVGSPLLLCFSHTELKYCRAIEQNRMTESWLSPILSIMYSKNLKLERYVVRSA